MLPAAACRHERNFWISLYSLTAWVVLLIVHRVRCGWEAGSVQGGSCNAAATVQARLLGARCSTAAHQRLADSSSTALGLLVPDANSPHPPPCVPESPFPIGCPCSPRLQVNREKHELRGHLLALQGRGEEAASEVTFMGRAAEVEMSRVGKAAAEGPLGASVAALVPAAGGAGKKEL